MQALGKWVGLFGKLSLAVAVVGAVTLPFRALSADDTSSWLFTLLLMALVSGVMIVAARLQASGNPLAEKAIPSSLVAYLLFLLMAARWLNS